MTRTVRPYGRLAQYYDQFFSSYRRWFDIARGQILGPLLPRVESACDLACGTGITALRLARRGIRMFAVDLSPAMCAITRGKARLADLRLRVVQADMREFRLPEPVDLILCEFDALNHVPRKADLTRVAKAAQRALRPGGHFYFDVNNRRAFEKYWRDTVWMEKPDVALIMRNGSDAKRDKAWSDVEVLIRHGKFWERHQEHVREVCWSQSEIRRALTSAGFGVVRAWDAARFVHDSITTRGCRTFFLARKRSA